jgi:CheY-like chemotaxis protein
MGEGGEQSDAQAATRRVVHDLRQPLAAMQMWLDLLTERLRGKLGEQEERYLAKVRAEMLRMAALLASSGNAPASAPGADAPAPEAAPSVAILAGVSLLVVEDDAMTAEALQLALEGEGASVVVADTVAAALASFASSPPRAVLSDLKLSDGDGFALIGEIRRLDAEAGRKTAAIAVTGFDSAETRTASRAAGFDDVVVKPFTLDDLVDRVARLLTPSR